MTSTDFFNTILGALLSLVPPFIYYLFVYVKNVNQKKLVGDWYVYSYSGDDSIKWVPHKLNMSVRTLKGFSFKCSSDAAGYLYSGYGHLNERGFSGNWSSNNQSANSQGTFTLIIEPQKNKWGHENKWGQTRILFALRKQKFISLNCFFVNRLVSV